LRHSVNANVFVTVLLSITVVWSEIWPYSPYFTPDTVVEIGP